MSWKSRGSRSPLSTGGVTDRLDTAHPAVKLKLDLLEGATPARHAIVYGDMWVVEGAYAQRCLELGCKSVTLIDLFETANWQRTRIQHPELEFVKGDFADPLFMASLPRSYEVGVAYDVVLHQASLLGALHLMCERVTERFVVAQPVLHERAESQEVVYLPGLAADAALHPAGSEAEAMPAVGPAQDVNSAYWIWAMTPSFLRAALRGEGFEVTLERSSDGGFANPRWAWWGCIAERVDWPSGHWSGHLRHPGLVTPPN